MYGAATGCRELRERRTPPNAFRECDTDADEIQTPSRDQRQAEKGDSKVQLSMGKSYGVCNAVNYPKTPMGSQNEAAEVKTLFMAHVPWTAEFDDVKEFFADAGEVVDVRFSTFEYGHHKGFCYVEFVSAEAAAKAFIEKQSKEFQGRVVRLHLAKGRNTQTPCSGNDGSFQKPAQGTSNSIFIRGFDKTLAQDEDDVVTARDNESREYEVLHTAKKQKQKYANRVDEEQKVSSSECEVKSCSENSKKHKKKLTGENSLMCHQCQRNDRARVIRCRSCTNKRFCVLCMQRWCVKFSQPCSY